MGSITKKPLPINNKNAVTGNIISRGLPRIRLLSQYVHMEGLLENSRILAREVVSIVRNVTHYSADEFPCVGLWRMEHR